jgi:UDP-2,4-diacetamido-2,4,6-trideoxy-beta-L-altropyranose hydrolase
MTPLVLRAASSADATLLWQWRNEEATRLNSIEQAPVPWGSHVAWLDRKLADGSCRIWILEDEARPVGQIRFERRDDVAVVNYSIDAGHRGRGLGTAILKISAGRACQELGAVRLSGLVKVSNEASCRAFVAAGFVRASDVVERGCACVRFERSCEAVQGDAA